MSKVEKTIIFKDLSYEIINSAIHVHNILGPGFSERIYEEAFCIELKKRNLPLERQKLIEVHYDGIKVGEYILDLIIDEKVLLELKATSEHNPIYESQVFSYLKATGLKLGILINFGTKKLTFKRIIN